MAQAAPAPKRNRRSQPETPADPIGQDLASLEWRRLRAGRMFDRGSTQAEVVRVIVIACLTAEVFAQTSWKPAAFREGMPPVTVNRRSR